MATFSTDYEVVVRFTGSVQEALANMTAAAHQQGATRTGRAMGKLAAALRAEAAAASHVLVVSDGNTAESPEVFAEQAGKLLAVPGVRVTAVGVGGFIDQAMLLRISGGSAAQTLHVHSVSALREPAFLHDRLPAALCV